MVTVVVSDLRAGLEWSEPMFRQLLWPAFPQVIFNREIPDLSRYLIPG
jgi:hypothetical protein